LRTPPYHPEFQPIETCWGIVKNEIARNCDFTIDDMILKLERAFDKVAAKNCAGFIRKIRHIEDTFWRDGAAFDEQN
jgi:transposase